MSTSPNFKQGLHFGSLAYLQLTSMTQYLDTTFMFYSSVSSITSILCSVAICICARRTSYVDNSWSGTDCNILSSNGRNIAKSFHSLTRDSMTYIFSKCSPPVGGFLASRIAELSPEPWTQWSDIENPEVNGVCVRENVAFSDGAADSRMFEGHNREPVG